jgi:glutamine synthetase
MLMAGLDGIEKKMDPGSALDKDIYSLSKAELKDVPSVPGSLADSLTALEKDHEFMLKGDVFTPDVIDTWLSMKRSKDVAAVNLRPHPYEFFLYYDA